MAYLKQSGIETKTACMGTRFHYQEAEVHLQVILISLLHLHNTFCWIVVICSFQ